MNLNEALDRLDVERNPAYQPRDGETFCNLYVHDVTQLLGCTIPLRDSGHWLTANLMQDWLVAKDALKRKAGCVGWGHAGAEMPLVCTWRNPVGHGHVCIVIPAPPGQSGVWVSQAGEKNHRATSIRNAFSPDKLTQVKFWTHP